MAAAVLSHRYIGDRFLPDKAIDLVDEAAARIRMEIDSMPQAIDEIERRVMQLQIERVSVARDQDDPGARERLGKIDAELAELKERGDRRSRRSGRPRRAASRQIGKIKEDIEAARQSMAEAERTGDLNRAAELRFGMLPGLERQLTELEPRPGRPAVSAAGCCARRSTRRTSRPPWRSGPASRSRACSRARSRSSCGWRSGSRQRVIGQDDAIHAVSNAVRRGRRRAQRSQPADRLVPVPGPDRRGQDRAGAGAGRVHVRRRAGHDPHRHVGVHGEAHGGPPDRRAARLRRATTRAASSRKRCAAARTRWCCSTRSRRRTPTSSTCCCSCSTTAV